MPATQTYVLNTGAKMPAIALGGWAGVTEEERAAAREWLLTALKAGYRHFDTAYYYGTEKVIGETIREFGIPREEVFITSKLPWQHAGMEEESIQRTLNNLGFDYVDLWLMHWPQSAVYDNDEGIPLDENGKLRTTDYPFTKTWAGMEKAFKSGKAKAIGVSNFSIKTLNELLATAEVVPAVNQVELHPYLAQPELVQFCKEKGIQMSAYTPTGYKAVRENPVIVELAKKYNVQPAQIIIAWHLSRGVSPAPGSKNPVHQIENINPPTLSVEDLQRISALDRGERICNKADKHGEVWGWSLERLGW